MTDGHIDFKVGVYLSHTPEIKYSENAVGGTLQLSEYFDYYYY